MKTEEKNNETKRCQSEKENWLQKCFHSSKYAIDHNLFNFFLNFFFSISFLFLIYQIL